MYIRLQQSLYILCPVVIPMPTITIYLTNALYDKVRDAPSKTVRAALEYYFKEKERPEESPTPGKQPAEQPGEGDGTAPSV